MKKFGFYVASFTSFITLLTFGIAIFTPPLSGPLCQAEKCYPYPYSEVSSRFPRDYYWIYPAIALVISYFLLVNYIHFSASENKKLFSQIGLGFAAMSSLVFLADFFLQISVIQPSLMKGEMDGISLLSQFNPHGIFIVLEELGYLLMSASLLFIALVFGGSKIEKSLKWIFVGNFILTLFAFIAYSAAYGIYREYRFEIASISLNWLTLIIGGILLSFLFKKRESVEKNI
jgi:hypothetical protein